MRKEYLHIKLSYHVKICTVVPGGWGVLSPPCPQMMHCAQAVLPLTPVLHGNHGLPKHELSLRGLFCASVTHVLPWWSHALLYQTPPFMAPLGFYCSTTTFFLQCHPKGTLGTTLRSRWWWPLYLLLEPTGHGLDLPLELPETPCLRETF